MKSLIRGKGKAMSLALSLAMALNLAVPAMAVDASGSTGTADAVLTQEAAAFSVSVPTVLPIAMDANHNISVANNLAIENNSRGQVKVSAAQVDAVGGWELVDYDTDFRAVKVDTKQFGFSLMGEPVPTTGEADATAFSVIDGQGELALTYDATVATQSMPTAETIARTVFTIGWNADAVDPYANYTPFTVTAENRDLVGYTGVENENLVIPATFSDGGVDYVVTSIGDKAFYGCTGLTSITIPDSVTSIGGQAFAYCSGLTSVTIPDSVTSIGGYAFYDCSGLTSITLPNSVTSIGTAAFYGCSGLTSITLPNSVTSIGYGAFVFCSSLSAISVAAGNTSYKSIDGVLYSYDGTVLIAYPAGKTDTSFAIPDGVTSIGDNVFYGCSGLTSITLPNSVTSIGISAFCYCSGLTSITLPNSVTSIGNGAFVGCTKLTSIVIPDSVTNIGTSVFKNCSSLSAISVAAGNTSYKSIDGVLYSYNGTVLVAYPAKKTETSFAIPDGVTSIGDSAFYSCFGLTSITLPNSVTSIGLSAFGNCSRLTSITIPDSVTSIGKNAFLYCRNLTSVTVDAAEGSIEGAPWGATNATINWLR